MMLRGIAAAALICASGMVFAQRTLTIDEALGLAKQANGTIRAARYSIIASRSAVSQAKAAFFPNVEPNLRYDISRLERHTGTTGRFDDTGATLSLDATWRLWDNGIRSTQLDSQKAGLSATGANALQTLRSTLFAVIQQYYETLRSQELLKVQEQQLARTTVILNQTRARAEAGDIAKKDIFQAEADQLNAQVSVLGARNSVDADMASLRALIGIDDQTEDLELVREPDPEFEKPDISLTAAIAKGIQNRADLRAEKFQLRQSELSVRLAQIDAGIRYSIDANYSRSFARDVSDRTGIALVASFPLFDGGVSREEIKIRRAQLGSDQARYEQDVRDATADIDTTYKQYIQNIARLDAAEAALAAARKNYDAVSAAHLVGAASMPEVVNAETSLVTAEVNYVQATYDALISESRLDLVVGDPVRGEKDALSGAILP